MDIFLKLLVKYLEDHPDQVSKLIEAAIDSLIKYLKPPVPPTE